MDHGHVKEAPLVRMHRTGKLQGHDGLVFCFFQGFFRSSNQIKIYGCVPASNARETKISSSSLVVEVAAQDDLLPVRANSGVKLAAAAEAASRGRQRHVALGAPDFVRGGRRLSEVILSVGNLERARRFHVHVVAIL